MLVATLASLGIHCTEKFFPRTEIASLFPTVEEFLPAARANSYAAAAPTTWGIGLAGFLPQSYWPSLTLLAASCSPSQNWFSITSGEVPPPPPFSSVHPE